MARSTQGCSFVTVTRQRGHVEATKWPLPGVQPPRPRSYALPAITALAPDEQRLRAAEHAAGGYGRPKDPSKLPFAQTPTHHPLNSDARFAEIPRAHTAGRLFDLQETVTWHVERHLLKAWASITQGQTRAFEGLAQRHARPTMLGLVLDGNSFDRDAHRPSPATSQARHWRPCWPAWGTPAGTLVVMDAGIATDANVAWLVGLGYRYLVVRRGGMRQFDTPCPGRASETAERGWLHPQEELRPDGQGALPRWPIRRAGRSLKKAMLKRSYWAFRGRPCSKCAMGCKKPLL